MKVLLHAVATFLLASAAAAANLDAIVFGGLASEKLHVLQATGSEVIKGGLDQPARRLLPTKPATWEGGRLSWKMKVDPAKPNYVTIRFWGSEFSPNRLVLFCNGKQIGYQHLGDYDLLDYGSDAPPCAGRFFYNTSPLPLDLTKGKQEVTIDIRSNGPFARFGNTFETMQKVMTTPARAIYAGYSHTDPYFVPPANEKQGVFPADPPVRPSPGPGVLDTLKSAINGTLDGRLRDGRPLGQLETQLLAKAYYVKWSHAYQNPTAIQKIVAGVDALYAAYKKDPKIVENPPGVYNPGWLGFGPAGDAVRLVAPALKGLLDEKLPAGVTRREGWAQMFRASADYLRFHRRLYTNQCMITDLNLYRSNRAVEALDPAKALPEAQALRYLYEALGMEPWLGSDTANGPEKPQGDNYYQLTAAGLTRELGFVGNYGEVLDWVTHIYMATVADPSDPATGDKKIRAQVEKIARARSVFRYPGLDADGHRAMLLEAVVGWRDDHYPGDVTYGERSAWEGSSLYSAAATLDPLAVGASQQMFADNQFFESVEGLMRDSGMPRTQSTLLAIPDQYDALKSRPPTDRRLPMTPGQPDFVFADEEDGVVAVKHGTEIFYTSLYWRARNAVNFLARVHLITPICDRLATVRQKTKFEPAGKTVRRPDWTGFAFTDGPKYPGRTSAHAGDEDPVAKTPPGEDISSGRGAYYEMRYGPYFIGMNTTKDQTFEIKVPADVKSATELVSGRAAIPAGTVEKVGPRSTIVLYLGSK